MGKQSREKRERLAERSFGGGGDREERRFRFQSGLEKACLFLITWGIYLILFTPLIINTKFFFPFVAPKTIFFRIIVEIILTAYIFLAVASKRWRPRINALTIAVTLFLAVFILASFTGINLSRSFWSTNERMTGILTMLHLFAFFIILSSVFKRRKDWEKLLGVSIVVGVFLSLYILMGDQISTRGGGTIGNTSFMAAYLLFDIFFALILISSNFLEKRAWPVFWQIFSGVSLLIMLPVLFISTARGAIVSFWIGLFLLFLGYLVFSQKKNLKRLALGIILLLVVLITASAVFQPAFVKNEVKSTLSEMASRFVVWEKGWEGFLDKPLLGWGPENFIVVFSKYFNPCMFLSECGGEIWFDRVHNIVLDTLVTTGIAGLLSYLAVFAVAFYGLFKMLPRIVERKNVFIPLGLMVLLLVYFAQDLLVFDMINTYLVFFLVLAFVGFLTQQQAPAEEPEAVRKINPFLALSVAGIMVFVFWTTNVQPLQANFKIIKTVNSQEINQASSFFQESLNTWMEKYEPREYFAQKMQKASYQEIPESGREVLKNTFALAETEMEKSIKQNYLDFRPHLFLGELYVSAYRMDSDLTTLAKAEQVLLKAVELSPTNQQGYWNLAEVRLAQGRIEDMIGLLKKAVDLEPRLAHSHWYLAMAYSIAGQNQSAKDEAVRAGELGYKWRDNIRELKRVIDIYLALNDNAGLVSLYLTAVKLQPDDAQLWASLAAGYANLGQYDKTREAAAKVIELNPSDRAKIEEFLKSLP